MHVRAQIICIYIYVYIILYDSAKVFTVNALLFLQTFTSKTVKYKSLNIRLNNNRTINKYLYIYIYICITSYPQYIYTCISTPWPVEQLAATPGAAPQFCSLKCARFLCKVNSFASFEIVPGYWKTRELQFQINIYAYDMSERFNTNCLLCIRALARLYI